MKTTEHILGEFIDAWKAGRRPDVDAYLARVDAGERASLARLISTWLTAAPTPDYDEATLAQIAQEPALVAAREHVALVRSPLGERLPRLRERAGMAVGEVARWLVGVFAIDDEQRATEYLERLERSELDESRLSRRLLDALAEILGADREQLTPRPAMAAGGQAFFRADEDAEQWVAQDIEALSLAALAPAPAEMDELDRLFLGGPGG